MSASAIRKFKINGTITNLRDIESASLMIPDLQNQLRLCTVTGSLHTLFAHPPTTFPVFCPQISKTEPLKRKHQDDNDSGKQPSKRDKTGSVNNTTGRKLFMPKGMTGRYCSDFLDFNKVCAHGEDCRFTHAVYPEGFEGNDAKVFEEYINNTSGLSFVKKYSPHKKVS